MLEKIMDNKSIIELSLLILTSIFLTQSISSELSFAQTPIEKTGLENNQSNKTILVCELVQFCTNPKEVQPDIITPLENNETKLIKPSAILPENTDESNISTIPENTDESNISTIPDVTSNISLIITPDIIDPLLDEDTQLPNVTTTEDVKDKVLTSGNLSKNDNKSEVIKVITPSNTNPINSTNNATTPPSNTNPINSTNNATPPPSNTNPINSTNNATTPPSNTNPINSTNNATTPPPPPPTATIKENQMTNNTSQEINSTNVNNQTTNPNSNTVDQQPTSPFPFVDQIFEFFGIK